MSLTCIDRQGRRTITEEQVDDYFAYERAYISVKCFGLGKKGNGRDSVQREIFFDYLPGAWKYINEKYQDDLSAKKI